MLVDIDVDLSFITLPFLYILLFYVFLSLFIFVVYFIADKRIKILQNETYRKNYSLIKEKNELCSIIIASRNEENVIRKTVEECLKQTYPNFEIIVVCHNCTDSTVKEASVNDPRVQVFDYKTKEVGKGVALNFGVEKSHGAFLLILDADGILSHDFIEKALPMLVDNAAVQGRYIPSNRNYSLISRLLSLEGDLWTVPYLTARTFLDKRGALGGTGYIIRKSILLEVGGFTNHLVDDYELSTRLLRKRHRIVFAPYCINYDEKPPSLDIMLRQRSRWARGFINMLFHHAVEPTDLLGFLFWVSPIVVFIGLIMLLIMGYAIIFNLIMGYIPFIYSSITITQWLLLTGLIWAMQSAVLTKQYGWNGLKYSAYLPIYNPFVIYVMISFVRALSIKSWGNTKTMHGFIKK